MRYHLIGVLLLLFVTTGCQISNNRVSETRKLVKLDATGINTVYLPTKAKVYQAPNNDRQITLLLEKYHSDHSVRPNQPHEYFLTINALKKFGCVYKKENDQLYISTQGEFSFIEGGSGIHIEALVPSNVKVVSLDSLQHRMDCFSFSKPNALADKEEEQKAEWTRCEEKSTRLKTLSAESPDGEIETIVVHHNDENDE